MSGCAVCVYDLYEESLDAHKDSVAAIRTSLSSLKIPESEWPPSIRMRPSLAQSIPPGGSNTQRKAVVMSAFEELEKSLNAKQKDTTEAQQTDSVGR